MAEVLAAVKFLAFAEEDDDRIVLVQEGPEEESDLALDSLDWD